MGDPRANAFPRGIPSCDTYIRSCERRHAFPWRYERNAKRVSIIWSSQARSQPGFYNSSVQLRKTASRGSPPAWEFRCFAAGPPGFKNAESLISSMRRSSGRFSNQMYGADVITRVVSENEFSATKRYFPTRKGGRYAVREVTPSCCSDFTAIEVVCYVGGCRPPRLQGSRF